MRQRYNKKSNMYTWSYIILTFICVLRPLISICHTCFYQFIRLYMNKNVKIFGKLSILYLICN